jgi:tryptophanase
VRACEIETVTFGLHPDGTETPAAMDLVRLAFPAAPTRGP